MTGPPPVDNTAPPTVGPGPGTGPGVGPGTGFGPGTGPITPVEIKTPTDGAGNYEVPDDLRNLQKSAMQPWEAKPESTVYFDFDKSTVRPDQVSKIAQVAAAMKNYPGKALRIEGHCDERGTEEYNRSLGERRALAVREYLIKEGMSYKLIDTTTFGKDRPIDPGHNNEAWSKNRRGEFILLDLPGATTLK